MFPPHPSSLAVILDHVAHVERLARAAEREGMPIRAERLRAMIRLSERNLARRLGPDKAAAVIGRAVRGA